MTALLIAGCGVDSALPGGAEETCAPSQKEIQGEIRGEIEDAEVVIALMERIKDAEETGGETSPGPETEAPVDTTPIDPEVDPTVAFDPITAEPPRLEAKKEIVVMVEPPAEEEPKLEAAKEIRVEATPTPPPPPPVEDTVAFFQEGL
jgi:hypothetical protein